MHKLLIKAAEIAIPDNREFDKRSFLFGGICIRKDGTMVTARNGAVTFSTTIRDYQMLPSSHVEGRLLRKAGHGASMFISRVSRKDGSFCCSRPCGMCRVRLKSFLVEKVFYTIDENHYGVFYPKINIDYIFDS